MLEDILNILGAIFIVAFILPILAFIVAVIVLYHLIVSLIASLIPRPYVPMARWNEGEERAKRGGEGSGPR